eukprot:362607-Chlamydomonas_euryale.AAC.19
MCPTQEETAAFQDAPSSSSRGPPKALRSSCSFATSASLSTILVPLSAGTALRRQRWRQHE